ncbi:MAG TPA: DinB family protein [Bacteroidia bacterium]|nr:DinB family protein [Bacteroidia bacterium]
MQIPKWTSREFIFDFPSDKFPFILERLRGTAARIEELTRNLPREKLTAPGPGNAWSIQEHVGHLIDLDELHDGRIDDYINNAEVLRPADMENKKTYAAAHNKRDLSALLAEFRSARNHFIRRLEKLNPEKTALHPRLKKPMRVVDMAFFVSEHDDHHLALMRLLI